MDHDQYVMLARRNNALLVRNKEIYKKMIELEQELNRNKLELEENVVKMKNAEKTMHSWQGAIRGQGYI